MDFYVYGGVLPVFSKQENLTREPEDSLSENFRTAMSRMGIGDTIRVRSEAHSAIALPNREAPCEVELLRTDEGFVLRNLGTLSSVVIIGDSHLGTVSSEGQLLSDGDQVFLGQNSFHFVSSQADMPSRKGEGHGKNSSFESAVFSSSRTAALDPMDTDPDSVNDVSFHSAFNFQIAQIERGLSAGFRVSNGKVAQLVKCEPGEQADVVVRRLEGGSFVLQGADAHEAVVFRRGEMVASDDLEVGLRRGDKIHFRGTSVVFDPVPYLYMQQRGAPLPVTSQADFEKQLRNQVVSIKLQDSSNRTVAMLSRDKEGYSVVSKEAGKIFVDSEPVTSKCPIREGQEISIDNGQKLVFRDPHTTRLIEAASWASSFGPRHLVEMGTGARKQQAVILGSNAGNTISLYILKRGEDKEQLPAELQANFEIRRELLPAFLKFNPRIATRLELFAVKLGEAGEYQKSPATRYVRSEKSASRGAETPVLSVGEKVVVEGESCSLSGFHRGNFFVSKKDGSILKVAPRVLFSSNPELLRGVAVQVRNSQGELESYAFESLAAKGKVALLRKPGASGYNKIKQVPVWQLSFDDPRILGDEKFIERNLHLVPTGIDVRVPVQGYKDATFKGLHKDGHPLVVCRNNPEEAGTVFSVDRRQFVANNRKLLLGVRAESFRLGRRVESYKFKSGSVEGAQIYHLRISPNKEIPVVIPDSVNKDHVLKRLNGLFQSYSGKVLDKCVSNVVVDPDPYFCPYWKVQCAATMSQSGQMMFYGGVKHIRPATLYHELGHGIASKFYGSAEPDDAWKQAASSEPSVSSYGDKNYMEDFAEFAGHYFSALDSGQRRFSSFREKYPGRTVLFEKALATYMTVD